MCRVVISLKEYPEFNSGNPKLNSERRSHSGMNINITVLDSYIKMKTLSKVSRILADPPQNSGPLKFLRNCTEMLFYLLIFFNIINFKHIF